VGNSGRWNKNLFAKSMFIGEYNHSLDNKGRLAIPAKFRVILKKGAVVTKGLDNCLFLYSKEQFKEMAKKFAALPLSQAKARAFARHMLAGAMDVEFDNQGRITLPEYLRSFSGLKKKVVVAGLYNHLEIWDQISWRKYKADSEKNSNSIAEALGDLGI
jgi:MraZ protein